MARIGIAVVDYRVTASPVPPVLADFEHGAWRPGLVGGEAALEAACRYRRDVAGFVRELRRLGDEPVGVLWAAAAPAGRLTARIREAFAAAAGTAPPVDGMLALGWPTGLPHETAASPGTARRLHHKLAGAVAPSVAAGAVRGLLIDARDDPASGGAGDTTGLLHALRGREAVAGVLYDPHVHTLALRAGVGAVLTVALGGKFGPPGERPFEGAFTVEHVFQGEGPLAAPPFLGRLADLPLALLRCGGLRVVVGRKRLGRAHPDHFRRVGVDPVAVPLAAVKAGADIAWPAACRIVVDAPGHAPLWGEQ